MKQQLSDQEVIDITDKSKSFLVELIMNNLKKMSLSGVVKLSSMSTNIMEEELK